MVMYIMIWYVAIIIEYHSRICVLYIHCIRDDMLTNYIYT